MPFQDAHPPTERSVPPEVTALRRLLRRVRRRWRRLRSRFRPHVVTFVYHRKYEWSLPATPIDPLRGERILAFLVDEGLIRRENISVPRRAALYNVLRAHDEAYVEALARREVVEKIAGVALTDREAERFLEVSRLLSGGTIQASRLALATGGIGVNIGGGMHHAERERGMAFCVFNDLAVAILRLRARGFQEPIVVVDLDLHDGNGTRAIFRDDPKVYTYSIHNRHWGNPEAVASTAIELGDGVGDELYLGTLLKTLPEVMEKVRPGLVFYVAGTDPARDDPLGNWQITAQGMLTRDRFVVDLCRGRGRRVPVVIVLGGGYGERSWRYSARFFSWLLAGTALEPTDLDRLTLARFRRIKATLDLAVLASEPEETGDWKLSAEDLAEILPGVPRRTKFLRFFSRHGVELLLEKFGILAQLRARGFSNPVVTLDVEHPMGQTLRIFGDPARTELLVELRVDRSVRVVPGMEVVVLEWLLLQNPRLPFTPRRPRLPGQQHPGLGMLREILGWLVMVTEILGLDGIYYVPSHFHVAAQSRKLVRFLRPEDEAWFRACEAALANLPLATASGAVHSGCLEDVHSGETVTWHACPMVLPVSDRLKERVFAEEYERRVREELDRIAFRLRPLEECLKREEPPA